jgi:hypothetical protein
MHLCRHTITFAVYTLYINTVNKVKYSADDLPKTRTASSYKMELVNRRKKSVLTQARNLTAIGP